MNNDNDLITAIIFFISMSTVLNMVLYSSLKHIITKITYISEKEDLYYQEELMKKINSLNEKIEKLLEIEINNNYSKKESD